MGPPQTQSWDRHIRHPRGVPTSAGGKPASTLRQKKALGDRLHRQEAEANPPPEEGPGTASTEEGRKEGQDQGSPR
ncbi:MAG: hypothetical protein ACI363_10690 [Phocaeicola plebeius]